MVSIARRMQADEQAADADVLSAVPLGAGDDELGSPANVAKLVRAFNASHEALKDLWSRTRRAADSVDRAEEKWHQAEEAAAAAVVAHRVIQDEQPRRRSPLSRQLLIAALTVALDGVACWFAAQALDGGELATGIWAALFLAVLAATEWSLDHYRERENWHWIAAGVGLYVCGLGVLRFAYLATVGFGGLLPALAGASLFTAATGAFVIIGYRALRAAESVEAWHARRRVRAARRTALAARSAVGWLTADWERLADTYIAQIRHELLAAVPSSQLSAAEAAVRMHLLGRD
jgi:hypothetical protein